MNTASEKIIVGITGASGSVYGYKLIQRLLTLPEVTEIAVVFSATGRQVWDFELNLPLPEHDKIKVYRPDDLFAPPASGSAAYSAMIIAPCSMGSCGKLASGVSDNLLTRAADVMLKEKRPLVLMFRESPLSRVHLQNLLNLSDAGAIIAPASPFFYHHPQTQDDLLDALVSRLICWAGLGEPDVKWGA